MTDKQARPGDKSAIDVICQRGETPLARETDWRRIGAIGVNGGFGGNRVILGAAGRFRLVKLRSRGAEVEVYRWTLHFEDGAILDLSVNCLPEGIESHPMLIAGRRLMGMAVEYEVHRAGWGSRLEIWAQS